MTSKHFTTEVVDILLEMVKNERLLLEQRIAAANVLLKYGKVNSPIGTVRVS